MYFQKISYFELKNLLNNSNIKFDGVDGEFYFKQNIIERKLNILQISNGKTNKLN